MHLPKWYVINQKCKHHDMDIFWWWVPWDKKNWWQYLKVDLSVSITYFIYIFLDNKVQSSNHKEFYYLEAIWAFIDILEILLWFITWLTLSHNMRMMCKDFQKLWYHVINQYVDMFRQFCWYSSVIPNLVFLQCIYKKKTLTKKLIKS